MTRRNGRLVLRIEEHDMGKKYEAYEKAAQAESASVGRLIEAEISGDDNQAQMAVNDLMQNRAIANATWDEFIEDPKG